MGPVSYRARSLLRARWLRALTVAVVVAAVGALVLTLFAGSVRTLSTSSRFVEALGRAEGVTLEQESGRPRKAEIAALPAVAEVGTATFVFGGLRAADGEWLETLLFAGDPDAFGERVVAGRAPDPGTPTEFVATRAWLSTTGAEIGDTFAAVTITQADAERLGFDAPEQNGPAFDATLVGVLDGPTELQEPTPVVLFGSGLLDVGDVGVATTVGVVTLAPGATIEHLREQLDSLPGGDGFGVTPQELVPADVRAAVRAQGQGLAIVAVIVAIAAVAVVGQLLSRQLRTVSSQKVALRAIGFTRAQVIADPVLFAVPPIVVGCVTAGAVAYVMSGVFPGGFARRVEPHPGLRVEPIVHIAGALLLAVVLLSWVLVSLRVGDRARGARPHPGIAETTARRLRPGPASMGARFAFVKHPRDPGAARVPLMGLVLVVVVVTGALTFGASVERVLDEPARFGYNFDFATGQGGDEVPAEMRSLLEQDPDVTDLTLYGTLIGSVGTRALDVTGMEQLRGSLSPDVVAGRLASANDEIVLGRVAARDLSVGIDDEIVITGDAGPVPFRVTGLGVIPSVGGGDGIGEGGVVTIEGLRRLDPAATLGVAAVRLRPGAGAALARISSTLGTPLGLPDLPPAVVNLRRARSTPFLVASVLAALAVLSMSHQVITATRRRRRDLAMLRALGAERRWVSRALRWQVAVLWVAVSVAALPLGVAAGRLAYDAYIDRIGARTDISVPFVWFAALVAGLLVLGAATAMIAARSIRREAPARTLATE